MSRLVFALIVAERSQRAVGQDGVAILPALGRADADSAALGIDVIDAEFDDFAHAQTGGVEQHEDRGMFGVAGSSNELVRVMLTEHSRQALVGARPWQLSQRARVCEHLTEEKAQRTDGLRVVSRGDTVVREALEQIRTHVSIRQLLCWKRCKSQERTHVMQVGAARAHTEAPQCHLLARSAQRIIVRSGRRLRDRWCWGNTPGLHSRRSRGNSRIGRRSIEQSNLLDGLTRSRRVGHGPLSLSRVPAAAGNGLDARDDVPPSAPRPLARQLTARAAGE